MVTPAMLVETLSAVTGIALPTVIDIDRKLVAAGLRTKGGRGLSAAHMTPLDAARLITAILVSPQANQAADAVRRYSETQADLKRSSKRLYAAADLEDLATLPARHSFIEALTVLIDSAGTGALRRLITSAKNVPQPQIEVFAFTRATYGRIRIFGLPSARTAHVEYVPGLAVKRTRTKKALFSATVVDSAPGDLEQSRRITGQTIFSIAKLLTEEKDDGCA